jgi:NAD(P)-dependent dehydrogenase (short-subunit alcohol dehydrogenase family)
MSGARTVLITGGTSGLGLRTAQEIARDGSWKVVVTGTDPARAAAAGAELGGTGMTLDLGSLRDVRRFADEYRAAGHPPLEALVLNAGIQHINGLVRSQDGFEATFAVNHLGHFLLANLLLYEIPPGGRVIVVASDTHDPAQSTGMPEPRFGRAIELARPPAGWEGDDPPALAGRRRYTTSKLCNVMFAREAAGRWATRGITVASFNPGLMPGTGLARDYPAYQRLAWRYVMPLLTLVRKGINTPGTSGRALARLATDQRLEIPAGSYFSGETVIASSAESMDDAKAQELWRASEELCATAAADGGPVPVG